jgi:hypothetical protein
MADYLFQLLRGISDWKYDHLPVVRPPFPISVQHIFLVCHTLLQSYTHFPIICTGGMSISAARDALH